MYIACFIDDKHYQDLYYKFGDTLTEVQKKIKESLSGGYKPLIWLIPNDEEKKEPGFILKSYANSLNKEDAWLVINIFEIEKAEYYLVRWHAYDGVGFVVKPFKDLESARAEMRKQYKKAANTYNNSDDNWIEDTKAQVDTEEWIEWEIIQRERGV